MAYILDGHTDCRNTAQWEFNKVERVTCGVILRALRTCSTAMLKALLDGSQSQGFLDYG